MSDRDTYPKRPSHLRHKYCRLLARTAAAQDIGVPSAWMCTVIAHLEDVQRYRTPISFWNNQLMLVLGTRRPDTFREWRSKAVEAGWLHYENRGPRRPGLYWVTIPPQFRDIPDGCFDDSDIDALNTENVLGDAGAGCSSSTETVDDHVSDTVHGPVSSSVHPPGPPPNTLNPSPERDTADASAHQNVRKKSSNGKPGRADWIQYGTELGMPANGVDEAWDHFEGNGWKTGRNQVKDWRACLRNWQCRQERWAGNGRNSMPAMATTASRRIAGKLGQPDAATDPFVVQTANMLDAGTLSQADVSGPRSWRRITPESPWPTSAG